MANETEIIVFMNITNRSTILPDNNQKPDYKQRKREAKQYNMISE